MSDTHEPKYAVVVQLWRTTAPLEDFVAFEQRALERIRQHGGVLKSVVRPTSTGDAAIPDEVHVIEFPSAQSYGSYLIDPRTAALASERATVVEKTIVWQGAPMSGYPS